MLLPVIMASALLMFGCKDKTGSGLSSDPAVTSAAPTQQASDGAGGDTRTPDNGRNPGDWNGQWNPGGTVKPTEGPLITQLPSKDENKQTADTNPSASSSKPVEVRLGFGEDGNYAFGEKNSFYTHDVKLTITAPEGSTIYYTLDGTIPNSESNVYSEPLTFKAHGSRFPEATILRARVMDKDGRWSKTAARTYLAGTKLDGRFSTIVVSVSGDPKELLEGPDGIFYGNNWEQRGRDSERMVYIEAWEPDGTNIFEQYGGVRVYGGYSRRATIKSMKLFARKSYDEENKNFKFSLFNTKKLDGSDKIIKKYDKLVLRNGGNDNMFAFVRDELAQRLVEKAGFDCFEAVIPAVTYFNGNYYNFYWMHENYCDKYFKEKFGDAEGEFVVLEGTDQEKAAEDDPLAQKLVDEYNRAYNDFIASDLTDDAVYEHLRAFMDVEDYLNFFAWNICINNWDWPNNNFKCYRYVEASAFDLAREGAAVTPSTKYYDGRWRYLPHDMDYTWGLYGQDKCMANYNTLRVVMNPNNVRYSPLFTKLMERADCRKYFRDKCYEFCNGVLTEESIINTYYELHEQRAEELHHYYDFLERMRRLGEDSLWASEDLLSGYEDEIFRFAKERTGYVFRYLDELLPEITGGETE